MRLLNFSVMASLVYGNAAVVSKWMWLKLIKVKICHKALLMFLIKALNLADKLEKQVCKTCWFKTPARLMMVKTEIKILSHRSTMTFTVPFIK